MAGSSTARLDSDSTLLTNSEARYRLLAENASDTVALAQADGTITWVSDSVTAMLGWQPHELVGRTAFDLIHPDDVGAVIAGQSSIQSGQVVQFQARIRMSDGGYRWVESRVRPVLDDTGTLVARVAGWRDIEEEHAARETLAVSEERYRMLAENASDIVYLAGPDRLIQWIAPSVERALGWTPDELVGTTFADLVHPDDQRTFGPDGERIYAGERLPGPETRYTLRVRSKDGRYRWFSCIGTPVQDAAGTPAGLIGGLKRVDDLVAERERARSEAERRQAILETLLDPYVLLQAVRDDAGRIVDFTYVDANDAACEYNQTPRDQLIGARLLDVLPGQAGSAMFAMYVEALESGRPLILNDYVYLHEILGSERRLDVRATRVGDALSFTWRDVTDRYAATERIAASEELLRANMDAVQDPLVLCRAVRDGSGRIKDFVYLDVNAATCEYLSWSREHLIGSTMLASMPGLADAGLIEAYAQAVDQAEPVRLDGFRYANEVLGAVAFYDIRGRGVSDDRLSLTWRDVTERQQAAERLAESEELLRVNRDAVQDPLVLLQAVRDSNTDAVVDFRYLDVNEATCAYLAMPRMDLIDRGLLELSPGLVDSGLFSLYTQAIESNTPTSVDDFRYANEILGSTRFYDIRAQRVSGDRLSLTWRDVTERHEYSRRIADAEEQYRLLAENSADVVLRVRGGRIVWMSKSVTGALGGRPADWIGVDMADVLHPDDLSAYVRGVVAVESGETVVQRARVRSRDDGFRWVEVHAKSFIDANGQPDGLVASMRVVEAEVAAERELERLARFDVLTGVFTRGEGLMRVAAATAQPRHPGRENGVLFCDVDRFKDINDTHGHAAGDLVLSTLTRRIATCVRQEDIVARMGGDEFLVLLAGIHAIEEAATIAEKIRAAAVEPIALGDDRDSVQASLSIGVALAVPGETTDHLIERADTAMYAAKKSGRNRVTLIH